MQNLQVSVPSIYFLLRGGGAMLFLLGLFIGTAFGLIGAGLCVAAREKYQEISVPCSREESLEGAA
jgi:hypothetical protein